MSQLSIGIGIRFESNEGALNAGESYTYDWHLSPWDGASLDTLPDWTLINDAGGIRSVGGGAFYPQSQTPIGCCSWHSAGVHANCYGRFECTNTWASAGDWIGIMLRIPTSGEFDGYALRMGDQGRYLERYDDGVATILDSDLTVPTTGQIYEMRIVGSTITTLVNGAELFADVVDATYDEGYFGIICKGLDTNVEIDYVRFGPYPKGNAFTGVNELSYPLNNGELWYADSCYNSGTDNVSDGSGSSVGTHAASPHDVGGTNMHWINFDFGKPFKCYGVNSYDRLTYHAAVHVDDCSWFGRNDEGDAWTLIDANVELQNPPNPDWVGRHLWSGGAVTYRYYRVEIYSTLQAADQSSFYEISFVGLPVA